MPFFNRFPYTNFHELNLDWILKKINEIAGTALIKTVNGKSADDAGNVEITSLDVPGTVRSVNNYNPDSVGNVDLGYIVNTVNNIAPSSNGNVNVGTVKQVNGNDPDAYGNVIAGTVRSINTKQPDSNGMVALYAGDIRNGVVSVNNTTPDENGNINLPTVAGVTSVNNIGADASGNVSLGIADIPNSVRTVNGVSPSNGNVALTPANIGAVATSDVEYKIYNSVTDLGLTSGSATIEDAWTALTALSILICPATDFANAELPGSYVGIVQIIKTSSTEGNIYFLAKLSTVGDYRMFLNESNIPDGTWNHIVLNNFLIAEDVSVTVGNINSGAFKPLSQSVAKSGYTVLGIVGYTLSGTGANYCSVFKADITGDTATISVKNNGSSTYSGNCTLRVLYKKD